MGSVRDTSDRFMGEYFALHPVAATGGGVPGYETELTDYSPEGIEARRALAARTLVELRSAEPIDDDDRRDGELLDERMSVDVATMDSGEPFRALNILHSPMQQIRQVFDLMARGTAEEWAVVAERMEKVPQAMAGVRAALSEGVARGLVAARRQAEACAAQARTWSGEDQGPGYFTAMMQTGAPPVGLDGPLAPTLSARLEDAARAANESFGKFGRFLRQDYLPRATEIDGVGAQRYALAARQYLGAEIDLQDTYRWGWDELHRIEADMARAADQIRAGATVAEVEAFLDTDPSRSIEGVDAFRDWLQELMDRTIDDLNGTHFDIPVPVRRVEAMIAPPGGAAAMYYTGPSEDFTRPGRTWYPTLGKTRFPIWGEVSIAYHEGVPGHHLQVGQVRYLGRRLSRFQRTAFVSGHGEGWALYAERLMDELGYLDRPDYRLGQLRAQAMRAVRVIVDIGMHLALEIPANQAFHPAERWSADLGSEFVAERSHFPAAFMASEIVRYLGMPGQAISYKVGERVWLEARDAARRAQGPAFDLKMFHSRALGFGPLGLDQLRRELTLA